VGGRACFPEEIFFPGELGETNLWGRKKGPPKEERELCQVQHRGREDFVKK